jgi:hypothetical protein
MRTTVALVILAVPLACSQSKPNDRNSTDACDSQAAAPTSVVLHVKGMI